jgi:hypothetical protein
MKKCKNYLSFLVILLFVQQITFAQTAVTAQADKSPAASSAQVKVFAKAVVLQNSVVHLVWEIYDASEIQSMVLESSDDGLTFSQIDYALVSGLIDIHLYNYPEQLDYNNHILMSSEHGGMRFMYNDVLQNRDPDHHPVWYRVKMTTSSGVTYISQHFSSNGQEQTKDASANKQPVPKSPCPSIGTPPSGYLSTGITRTTQGLCCTYTETRYYNPDTALMSPVPGCPNGNDWCCSNVPEALTCAAGYAVDYCCVHHCADYAQCSCLPWTCCTNTIDSVWVVTSSNQNAPFPVTATATPATICNGEYTTLSATASPIQPGMTFLWLPGYAPGSTVLVFPNTTVNYTVIATDSSGNCTGTAAVTVTVNQPVTPIFNIFESICEGYNFTLPSVSNNGFTGSWAPAMNNTVTMTYTFTPDPGQCANSTTATVNVYPVPPTPTIVLNGSVLYSSALTGNQWYFNGTIIPSATGYFYNTSLTGNGNYYVIVTDNSCTSDTSNYLLVNVGIEENSATIGLNIYPNPANEMITVETASSQQDKVISLLNVLGQIVMQQPMAQQRSEIDVRMLSKGLYFLKLTTKNGSVVRKFVKE